MDVEMMLNLLKYGHMKLNVYFKIDLLIKLIKYSLNLNLNQL